MDTLRALIDALNTRHQPIDEPYYLPGLWLGSKVPAATAVNPYEFYAEHLLAAASRKPEPLVKDQPGGEWTRRAIVYNLFPRVATAFDHNQDGHLSVAPRADGWRETGTLLKTIALLPYIRKMGFNTVHLLPITSVGQDGKKGTLGSPYAIRNHYQLDANLAEPALDFSAEQLFKALVEAAHHLGLRVVMEFVLRTAAKDADIIGEHPEWFYWIRAGIPDRVRGRHDPLAYGAPVFNSDTLGLIKWKVHQGDFKDLPAPSPAYQEMFTAPPRPESLRLDNGRWTGTLDDGTPVRIPGAFSDYPPDDPQPPWSDVTYLRMYDHPDFNYMAYNTLRMYDQKLAKQRWANKPLWEWLIGVIPYYQERFGIDGVMFDMGHALPAPLKKQIVKTARQIDRDFAFWDENFGIEAHSRDEGYNAVMGYYLFELPQRDALKNFVWRMASGNVPIPFFATAENHNTPRAASRDNGQRLFSHYTLPLCIAVPGVPFVHSGFELFETQPVNTGIGFSPEQLRHIDSSLLPLFSEYAFNWTRPDNLVEGIAYILELRRKYEDMLISTDPDTWHIGWSDNPNILVFTRRQGQSSLTFIANMDKFQHQAGRAVLGGQELAVQGLWGTSDPVAIYQDLNFYTHLLPAYVLVLEGDQLPINGWHQER